MKDLTVYVAVAGEPPSSVKYFVRFPSLSVTFVRILFGVQVYPYFHGSLFMYD